MAMNEILVERWLARGSKFFKAVSRNAVIRGTLRARGLTDEELRHGWQLYEAAHGFSESQPALAAVKETAAAQAMNAVDAWDAPTYAAAHAVLDVRLPAVSAFLFQSLHADTGPAAVAGVRLFLDRIDQLREGKAPNIDPEAGRAAVELLATRKIVDATKATEMRSLIQTAQLGAQPGELIEPPTVPAQQVDSVSAYVNWLNEWREVARVAISRRDYRIALGLAQRRQTPDDTDDTETENQTTAASPASPV